MYIYINTRARGRRAQLTRFDEGRRGLIGARAERRRKRKRGSPSKGGNNFARREQRGSDPDRYAAGSPSFPPPPPRLLPGIHGDAIAMADADVAAPASAALIIIEFPFVAKKTPSSS